MSDATILLRDIAGDAAQNAATKINPSEDALGQIDHAAEDNTWHDVPDLSAGNLKAQARDQYNRNKPFNKDEAKDAAGNAMNKSTAEDGSVDPNTGANVAASNLKAAASENIPEETKQTASNYGNRTKGYLGDKMPKERREQTVYRLKKMIVEVQSHSDCKHAHWSEDVC